jgi:hypothetical protein
MELCDSAFGAGFWRISARVEQWRQTCTPFMCAGAGAQGWCDIMLHSSISTEEGNEVDNKILIEQWFLGVLQMERGVARGSNQGGRVARWR